MATMRERKAYSLIVGIIDIMEAKKITAGISVRNKFLLRHINMENKKMSKTDTVAIAQMSVECKKVLAKLIASNDRDLNIIAHMV